MSLAVQGPARAPFQRLHEIGKALMKFDRLEDVIPRVLDLVGEDGLLLSGVLITSAPGPDHPFVWRGGQVSASAVREAVKRARAAHESLMHPSRAPRLDQVPGLAAHPLIDSRGEVLGTLALQWALPPDGDRLAFGEDVCDLLAIAMDRDARVLRATRSNDDLLATVSHEMKNLLAAMRGNLDLLHRSAALLAGDKPPAPLRRMQRASDRMGRLIQDLLDVGCAEARPLSVEPLRLEVALVLEEALEAAAPLAADRDIQLRCERSGKLPEVLADAARLQQVFANLLSNAIKFSPEGGAITVRAQPCAEGVTFSVQDHGMGIDEEERPHLFDRFWQGRRAAAGQGYGLGLFIVQSIVRAHGGRIWVASEVGQGSTFFFTVPAAGSPAELAPGTGP